MCLQRHTDVTEIVNEKTENSDSASGVSERGESKNLGSNQQAGYPEQHGEQKRNNNGTSLGNSSGYSPFVPSTSNSRKPVSVKVGQTTAGGSVDFYVAAFDAGQMIAKDGIGFSLIGAGGFQLNINKNLGLFLDPTFSWSIPSDNRKFDTYRSEHPFMFMVSTGLRATVSSKK